MTRTGRISAVFAALFFCIAAEAQWDKDVISYRGRLSLQEGKYAAAIEQFNALARIDTTDYWNFFYRGIAKYNLGDIRGAQNDFDRSVRLNPIFTNGYHYRAITESRSGRYDDALADLEKAISLRPGNIGLYFSRGVTYIFAQRFREALADFDRYIEKEPKDASAYLNRGATYLFLKDTTNAINDYNKAIKIDRRDSEGYIRRGRVYAEQKKYDDAISDMTKAIEIDGKSTLAYFTRAFMYHEKHDYNAAMKDFDKVLEIEPGNSLTLYNRSLLFAHVGDYGSALKDINRVIDINPDNVLAHYNRAAYYIELGRLQDAVDDYSRAIALYPDFAQAYMNRSNVEWRLGRMAASKSDYNTAKKKIAEYKSKNLKTAYSDTTGKYSSLLALDSDFSKKDFNDELLQHRDVDVRLKPLFRFVPSDKESERVAFSNKYENVLLERFMNSMPVKLKVSADVSDHDKNSAALSGEAKVSESQKAFLEGLEEIRLKNYNRALQCFDLAVDKAADNNEKDRYSRFYRAFYYLNRGVLKAEMADFLSKMESSVQTLRMDDKGATNTRVKDKITNNQDYSKAIADLEEAARILPEIPYAHFDLGNLYCLSSRPVEAIESYSKAIGIYPEMGEAYYNRGLVLILVKDKDKGCIDLSKAGELGIKDSYSLIGKYCKNDE